MSNNKDLFKEAIADAKAVREAALANAKAALEEALAPKLQSMLSAKLQEMEKEEEDLQEVDHSSDTHASDDQWHKRAHAASAADAAPGCASLVGGPGCAALVLLSLKPGDVELALAAAPAC